MKGQEFQVCAFPICVRSKALPCHMTNPVKKKHSGTLTQNSRFVALRMFGTADGEFVGTEYRSFYPCSSAFSL